MKEKSFDPILKSIFRALRMAAVLCAAVFLLHCLQLFSLSAEAAEQTAEQAAGNSAENGGSWTQESEWVSAYIHYLDQFPEEGQTWEEVDKLYRYSLIDIDGDRIPELFMIPKVQWTATLWVVYYHNQAPFGVGFDHGEIYYIPGELMLRITSYMNLTYEDEFYQFDKTGFVPIAVGSHYYDNLPEVRQAYYYWDGDEVTKEEYTNSLNAVFDESRQILIEGDYDTKEELLEAMKTAASSAGQTEKAEDTGGTEKTDAADDTEKTDETGDTRFAKYPPYLTIALQSATDGKYLTCNIGSRKKRGKDKGKYEKFDEPDIRVNASEIGWYEMFNLVRCSDGTYALQADNNRQFLSEAAWGPWDMWKGVYAQDDFIEEKHKIRLDLESRETTIQFVESGRFLLRKGESLTWKNNADESQAERFKVIILDDNTYDQEEKQILTSSEWFGLNGKKVGYWNIQDEIGRGKADSLIELGYCVMHYRYKDRDYIQNKNMECSVGVRPVDGNAFEVIVAFQGTSGEYGPIDNGQDIMQNTTGGSFEQDGMHPGYAEMARHFRKIEEEIATDLNGSTITYKQILDKAKEGKAHITLLGHSMGGAIAQIYAVMLVNEYKIPSSAISGRTFNSALGLIPKDDWPEFKDWVNLCVTSDSVPNGLVPGSIVHYGLYRIGKTIWLYDDKPDKEIEGQEWRGNIVLAKHNMDAKLKEILEACCK